MTSTLSNAILLRISYVGLFLDPSSLSSLDKAFKEYTVSTHALVQDAHVTILHSPTLTDDLSILSLIGHVIELEAFAFVRGKKALSILVRWPSTNSDDIFSGDAAIFVPPSTICKNQNDDLLVDYSETNILIPSSTVIEEEEFLYSASNYIVYSTISKISSNALSRNPFPHITLFLEESQSGRVSNDIIRQAVSEKRLIKITNPLKLQLRVGVACYTKEGRVAHTSMSVFKEWLYRKMDTLTKGVQPER